jgi:Amt family ammonium transporter
LGAIALGAGAGLLCSLAIGLKFSLGYDDSLDVVAVHLVGGLWGTVAIGFLANPDAPAGVRGLLHGGGIDLLVRQGIGAVAVLGFSFVTTCLIAFSLDRILGLRVSEDHEEAGVDVSLHAEQGYALSYEDEVFDADPLGS